MDGRVIGKGFLDSRAEDKFHEHPLMVKARSTHHARIGCQEGEHNGLTFKGPKWRWERRVWRQQGNIRRPRGREKGSRKVPPDALEGEPSGNSIQHPADPVLARYGYGVPTCMPVETHSDTISTNSEVCLSEVPEHIIFSKKVEGRQINFLIQADRPATLCLWSRQWGMPRMLPESSRVLENIRSVLFCVSSFFFLLLLLLLLSAGHALPEAGGKAIKIETSF